MYSNQEPTKAHLRLDTLERGPARFEGANHPLDLGQVNFREPDLRDPDLRNTDLRDTPLLGESNLGDPEPAEELKFDVVGDILPGAGGDEARGAP